MVASPAASHAGTTHVVVATLTRYVPSQPLGGACPLCPQVPIRINQGDSLLLVNAEATLGFGQTATHDLEEDGPFPRFYSGPLGPGESSLVAGVESLMPGSYSFHCSYHESVMYGILVVEGEY